MDGAASGTVGPRAVHEIGHGKGSVHVTLKLGAGVRVRVRVSSDSNSPAIITVDLGLAWRR